MATRMRSPNYPSISLAQGVDIIEKIYSTERTNPIDREVAAEAMGYTGITGRSAKVLADLLQYGLLEKAGKSEVRVTARAVDILHPDTVQTQARALRAAAQEPELFQRILERFSAGHPSDAALKSFLMREGFTDAAISPARRAYLDTIQYVENFGGAESASEEIDNSDKNQLDQRTNGGSPIKNAGDDKFASADYSARLAETTAAPRHAGKATFQWDGEKILLNGGVIASQEEVEKVIQFLTAIKPMLASAVEPQSANSSNEDINDPSGLEST